VIFLNVKWGRAYRYGADFSLSPGVIPKRVAATTTNVTRPGSAPRSCFLRTAISAESDRTVKFTFCRRKHDPTVFGTYPLRATLISTQCGPTDGGKVPVEHRLEHHIGLLLTTSYALHQLHATLERGLDAAGRFRAGERLGFLFSSRLDRRELAAALAALKPAVTGSRVHGRLSDNAWCRSIGSRRTSTKRIENTLSVSPRRSPAQAQIYTDACVAATCRHSAAQPVAASAAL